MSIPEVNALIQQQTAFILDLKKENKKLEARVAELSAKIPATVASTQTEPLVSAASDLDKLASDLAETTAVVSSKSEILDLSTKILTLTIRNDDLTTQVESLQVDLDDARQALAAQPERTKRALFAAGTVAVLAAGALVVANDPEAAKKTFEKALACVAKKASSVASFLIEKSCDGLDFLRNSNNVNAVEIDLTKMLKQ
jgi:cell division protein FtsB